VVKELRRLIKQSMPL